MALRSLHDVQHWREIVAERRWEGIPNEELAAAFLTEGTECPRLVANGVAKRLSDEATRIARRNVSRSKPNGGLDIVEDTASIVMEALLTPGSPLAVGLTVAFALRVRQKAIDLCRRVRWTSALDEVEGGMLADEFHDVVAAIDQRRALEAAPTPEQREMLAQYFAGFSMREIADRFGWKKTRTRMTLGRLLQPDPPQTEGKAP